MGGRAKLYHGRDCGKRLIRHDTDQPIDFAAALSKRTGVYLALTTTRGARKSYDREPPGLSGGSRRF